MDKSKSELLEEFEKTIELDPKDAKAWYHKGSVLYGLNRYEDALPAFEKTIELDPKYAPPWSGKGVLLAELNCYGDALPAFNKAIELDPKYALPWLNKTNPLIELHRFSDIQGCFFRFYRLCGNLEFYSYCHTFLNAFEEHCDAPLFIHRVFTEFPQLQTSLTRATLRQKAFSTSSDMLKIIDFMNTNNCHLGLLERKKLEGIILYCMGDPIMAGKVFNEVDDIDEMDLMGQCYIVASLDAYFDDTDGERTCALENARKYIKSGEDEIIQFYYAGHIFIFNNDYEAAAHCFKKSDEFLPSLYMELAVAHDMDNTGDIDVIAGSILDREYKLMLDGGKGFLQGISPYEIDINGPEWNKPMEKYAHYLEIIDSIDLVYEWLEKYEKENKEVHPIRKYSGHSKQRDRKMSFDVWILKEQSIAQLEQYAKEVKQKDLEEAEIVLNKCFTAFPFPNMSYENTEKELAVFIENADFTGETKQYQLLVEYYCFRNLLSIESAMLLSFYISYKEINSMRTTGNKEVYVTTAAATSVSVTLGLIISGNPALMVPLSTGGAVLGAMLGKYLVTMFHGKAGPISNYKTFKNNFIEYAAKIKDVKGEDISSRDIEQLIDDLTD